MARLYEQAWERSTHGTIHAPPQHGKTKLTETFVIASLRRAPYRIVYATYESHRAWRVSASIRKRGQEGGLVLADDERSKEAWQTRAGGSLIATGVGGPLTGEPADILIIDDPYKNRTQALSAIYNANLRDWFQDVVESRTHKGSSIFVHHTRWHSDDLIGWLQSEAEYQHYENIRLPALNEDGSGLWEYRHKPEELRRRQRANPDMFAGLYQGLPPITTGKIFTLATYEPPGWSPTGRVGIGMDGAYSKKKAADSCAIVVLREVSTFDEATGRSGVPYYVVEDAHKARCPIEEFKPELRSRASRFPGTRIRWSGAGAEQAIADNLTYSGIPIDFQHAGQDKVARSNRTAEAWRLGLIRVPEHEPWAADFVDEVTGFTGVDGKRDDYVDALTDAFESLAIDGLASYIGWITDK